MNWQADTVQFVLFPASPLGRSAHDLWREVTDSPPLNFQQAQGLPSNSMASGTVGAFGVLVMVQFDRVALLLTPFPGVNPTALPVIKDAAEAVDFGLPLAQKLSSTLPNVSRLAIIVEANRSEASVGDAVASVRSLTRINVPDDVLDLSFQLNRRRPSSTPGYNLNRLCRWQTTTKALFHFASPVMQMTASTVTREEHFTGLVVDVNTVQAQEIGRDARDLVFRELAEEVRLLLDDAYGRLTN